MCVVEVNSSFFLLFDGLYCFLRLPVTQNSISELLKADLTTFVEATLDPATKTERTAPV